MANTSKRDTTTDHITIPAFTNHHVAHVHHHTRITCFTINITTLITSLGKPKQRIRTRSRTHGSGLAEIAPLIRGLLQSVLHCTRGRGENGSFLRMATMSQNSACMSSTTGIYAGSP